MLYLKRNEICQEPNQSSFQSMVFNSLLKNKLWMFVAVLTGTFSGTESTRSLC